MKNNQIFNALGRISRQRGNNEIIGFMPLKEFHTEKALDFSTITALRMNYLYNNQALENDFAIKNWIHVLCLEVITEAFSSYKNYKFNNIYEICGGISPLRDFLVSKNIIDSANYYNIVGGQDKEEEIRFVFNGKFLNFSNIQDFFSLNYHNEKNKLIIFNQNYSIRNSFLNKVDWVEKIAECENEYIISCIRLTDNIARLATTIKGDKVWLNSVSEFLNNEKLKKENWCFKLIHEFDKNFILPEINNGSFVENEKFTLCIAIKGLTNPPNDFQKLI